MSQKKQKHQQGGLKKKKSQGQHKWWQYLFSATFVSGFTVIGTVAFLIYSYRDWLLADEGHIDLVTLGMGFVALLLLVWRSSISEKQLKISQEGRDDDHFTRAIEQTANSNMAIRLAGLTALRAFSRKDQEKFQQIWDYLGEFLRYPPDYDGREKNSKKPRAKHPDISFITDMLRDNDIKLWQTPNYRLPLSGTKLIGADLSEANLRAADLSRADLRGADLFGADLRGADLFGADLNGANLFAVDLRGADLRVANLHGANLFIANLRKANLIEANLTKADLSAANLRGADLRGANLSGANLRTAKLGGADLRAANLSWAELGVAKLGGADFSDSFFSGKTITKDAFLIGKYDLSMCSGLTKQHLEALYLAEDSPEPILPKELKDKVTWQRISHLEWEEMQKKHFIQRP